jgi:hypothetical protein
LFVVNLWLSLPGLPPSSTGARAKRPCNPLTPASYQPGLFLAIDNNQGKEKAMAKSPLEQLPSDPVALATVEAIDNLLALLLEAKNYLESGQSLAALGTLQLFDNHADDLKAAIRLTVMAQRRRK